MCFAIANSDMVTYLVFGGWGIGVVEYLLGVLMIEWAWNLGLPVRRKRLPVGGTSLPAGDFETKNVKARRVGAAKWIFRRKQRLFDLKTPFEIRGVVKIDEGTITIRGRQAWGAFLFFAGFAILIWSVGLLFSFVFCGVCLRTEWARFDADYKEVAAALGGQI